MTQRVNLYLEDDFAQELRQRKPKSLSLSAFCCWMIEDHLKSLDSVARLATCSAGAGYSNNLQAKAKQENEADQVSASHKNPPSTQEKENSPSPAKVDFGGGIGMGLSGEGKRGVPFVCSRHVPKELEWCREPLLEFWREKGGKKSKQAATFLFNQLITLTEKYGQQVVLDQLELATAKGFDSITVKNYEQFGLTASKGTGKPQEPEMKHPASRVFTAKDGFGEPAANPALQELF